MNEQLMRKTIVKPQSTAYSSTERVTLKSRHARAGGHVVGFFVNFQFRVNEEMGFAALLS